MPPVCSTEKASDVGEDSQVRASPTPAENADAKRAAAKRPCQPPTPAGDSRESEVDGDELDEVDGNQSHPVPRR